MIAKLLCWWRRKHDWSRWVPDNPDVDQRWSICHTCKKMRTKPFVMKQFIVWHEKGGFIHVFAENKEKAIDAFYEAISSMVGHTMKICGCFGPEKPIDRSKVIRPVRVEEFNDADTRKLLHRDL